MKNSLINDSHCFNYVLFWVWWWNLPSPVPSHLELESSFPQHIQSFHHLVASRLSDQLLWYCSACLQLTLRKEKQNLLRLLRSVEKAMAPHSSTLAWKIPWMEEPGGLRSMGSLRVGHNWAASLSCIGEGNGNPLQCSCLENPRDGGAWWAAIYGVAQSWTRLKRLSSSNNTERAQPCPCMTA